MVSGKFSELKLSIKVLTDFFFISARMGGIIGNVVIASLLDTYCPAPTFIVAVLLAGGGLMCLFLPNTTKKALS